MNTMRRLVVSGNAKKLENVLKQGPPPSRSDLEQLLAGSLLFAFKNQHENVVNVLLQYGARKKWNTENNSGLSSIIHMTMFQSIQEKKEKILKLLLEHGANPNRRDSNGYTPLHRASIIPNSVEIIRLLIRYGADVNAKLQSHAQSTPLYMALHRRNWTILHDRRDLSLNVHALVDIGKAKLNVKNGVGATALHIAVLNNYADTADIVQFLIDRGAYVNVKNDFGETPLHVAVKLAKKQVIKILLENGAIPYVRNANGKTPLDHITNLSHKNVKNLLLTWPGQRSVLRRMATASLNSVRNRNTGQKIHVPNNVKQRILSKTGLFHTNQFGRPKNNISEIRNAWKKEQNRKRKRNT